MHTYAAFLVRVSYPPHIYSGLKVENENGEREINILWERRQESDQAERREGERV